MIKYKIYSNLTKKYTHDEEQKLVLEGTEMLNELYIELDLVSYYNNNISIIFNYI